MGSKRVILAENLGTGGSIAIRRVRRVEVEIAQVRLGLRKVGNAGTLNDGSCVAKDLKTMPAK